MNFDPADTAKVQREMSVALKARRTALEEALSKRLEELKQLCIKEGVCHLHVYVGFYSVDLGDTCHK